MNSIGTATVEVRTFGQFTLIVNGSETDTAWPDETARILFCSLLSPLDEYVSLERISRSLWGVPATRTSSMRIMGIIQKLRLHFLGLGDIDPFIMYSDGIALNQKKFAVDANTFRTLTLEGLRLLAKGKRSEASERLRTAYLIYRAPFLPGIPGKLVDATRDELDGLYGMVATALMPTHRMSHG
jgi:DNA-binding SARP family transcriptional activator